MKVLLADDNAMMRRLLEATLQGCGHDVSSAADGGAAWEAYERVHPPLVILDWQMPVLDGLEVCRRIRSSPAGRDTFVLVVTACDEAEHLVAALDAGADDYLTKPVTPDHLRARLTIAARRIEQNAARWQAEAALARAQWLAGIGETTLALQHEINNPLVALLIEAEMLAADAGTTEEQRAQIALIVEQASRISAVVKRLSTLEAPRSVEYVGRARMLDLSGKGQ